MPTLNNFSVLPWYKNIEGQDFRRWWKYGNIYPLYTGKWELIPSQIMRSGNTTGYNPVSALSALETVDSAKLTEFGIEISSGYNNKSWVDVYEFDNDIILTFAERYNNSGVAWSLSSNNSGFPSIAHGNNPATLLLSDYSTAAYLLVERTASNSLIENRVWLADGGTGILLPRTTTLHKLDGTLAADLYSPSYAWAGKHISSPEIGPSYMDYLVYNTAGNQFDTPMPIGQYYLKASDGINEWVSDVITVVNSIDDLVLVQWSNEDDFFMDAGAILYHSLVYFNQVYLQAEVAKPEYEFEDEGETRDGVFYPTKQISKKKYKFNFLATEYLLDVMRFVRMADYITIRFVRGGETITLYPSSFLISPEWEKEGDFAGVSAEFETDTVAKKTGRVVEYPPV